MALTGYSREAIVLTSQSNWVLCSSVKEREDSPHQQKFITSVEQLFSADICFSGTGHGCWHGLFQVDTGCSEDFFGAMKSPDILLESQQCQGRGAKGALREQQKEKHL